MRKLVEWTFVSLDGVIDSPEWAQPYMDDEHHRCAVGLLDEADALLLGRKSYQGLADFWSKQTGEIADRINSRPKYVASRTLAPGAADSSRAASSCSSTRPMREDSALDPKRRLRCPPSPIPSESRAGSTPS
jgi:dihydrofolate reductase